MWHLPKKSSAIFNIKEFFPNLKTLKLRCFLPETSPTFWDFDFQRCNVFFLKEGDVLHSKYTCKAGISGCCPLGKIKFRTNKKSKLLFEKADSEKDGNNSSKWSFVSRNQEFYAISIMKNLLKCLKVYLVLKKE